MVWYPVKTFSFHMVQSMEALETEEREDVSIDSVVGHWDGGHTVLINF